MGEPAHITAAESSLSEDLVLPVLSTELLDSYGEALRAYLVNPHEQNLQVAHRLGHEVRVAGLSLLQMTTIHHQAMRIVVPSRADVEESQTGSLHTNVPVLAHASDSVTTDIGSPFHTLARSFFAEALRPFELSRREAEESIAVLQRQNQELEERTRQIGRDIGEQTLQILALVNLQLDKLESSLPAGVRKRSETTLARILELLEQVGSQLTGFSDELWRTKILEDLGIAAAVDALAKRFSKEGGIRIQVSVWAPKHFPHSIERALLDAIEEALTNVILHSGATLAQILIQEKNGTVTCCIHDNGVGFDPSEVFAARGKRGLGLISLRRVARLAGGSLTMNSDPARGTELVLTFCATETGH